MGRRSSAVALLLFGSGFCALIYQTTWLREFRLVFGMSTAASAVVLGVFMAGIGFGGIALGRRSEKAANPLRFYARLEFLIAVAAALSPILIYVAREIYIVLGGTSSLGIGLGTAVRLILAAIIIGLPTFLMGGTLPAAARAAVGISDMARRKVGLLYGANSLGAVAGALVGTFYCFEHFGNRATLWSAAVLNILIAVAAFYFSKSEQPLAQTESTAHRDGNENPRWQTTFILAAAGAVGFVFFLMELVWYRMLGPLLGGTTFSFGLILATALLGIGIGGMAYSLVDPKRVASLNLFGLTCAAEAFAIGVSFMLGDRIAELAMLLRPLGTMGFYGYVTGWAVLCLIVVFPAALIAGFQFPVLISLLGTARNRVGLQIGLAYGWNTFGALAGSLAGGFGLIPLLSAPGVWELVVAILCLVAVLAVAFASFQCGRSLVAVTSLVFVVSALLSLTAAGPTAFWRHSQIGVGSLAKYDTTPNEMRDLIRTTRREAVWEKDGIESSLALIASSAYSFFVNGRSDGNAKADAGTQVMVGLIGALLHPNPTKAMVVGLGTGSTAGWLAAVPTIARVDVVELEPEIRHVAEVCAPVNHDALANPKMHLAFGDAREWLLTTRENYDVIVSEPSNPHRAGVASVFTRNFYQSVAQRLTENGIFCQWLQGYDIDDRTVQTVYRTIRSVFGSVQSWETEPNDLLLVASRAPIPFHVEQLRARIAEEPYHSALVNSWVGTSVEDFLAHFVGNEQLGSAMANLGDQSLNTDDRTVIEFALARAVGRHNGFRVTRFRAAAQQAHIDRPTTLDGPVDWQSVDEARLSIEQPTDGLEEELDSEQRARAAALASYSRNDLGGAWQWWRAQSRDPQTLPEQILVADCLASEGDNAATPYIDRIAAQSSISAQAIRARLLWNSGERHAGSDLLMKVLNRLHEDPWLSFGLTSRMLLQANEISNADSSNGSAIAFFNALNTPLAVRNAEAARMDVLFNLALRCDGPSPANYTEKVMQLFEPNIPWQLNFLRARELSYEKMRNPRAAQAQRDLEQFEANEPASVDALTRAIQNQAPQPVH